ncbi:MAG: DNA alkylation repair protein [Candidatus Dojkabacteria bacterium]
MKIAEQIKSDLQKIANPEKSKNLSRFFKTGKGEYGEGDQFLGITVPDQRIIAKKYFKEATLEDVDILLKSPIHEHRLTSLFILCYKYTKSTEEYRKKIFDFYLDHLEFVNNWDMVDLSAERIIGEYLLDKDRSLIYKLAKSDHLWTQRVSILTTFQFIKNNDFADALKISEYFLTSKHDLIQKASGWMLKEIGKRDVKPLIEFLDNHYKEMPRTMLRYCIEKLSDTQRKHYLGK